MYQFLVNNRSELIDRCRAKVGLRSPHGTSTAQLANGIPLFLDQFVRTLHAEAGGDALESLKISGASGGDTDALSEMGKSAAAHGKALLELGFTIEQVVHDYGDLCQAITDLAVETDAPFSIDQFRTLNRCLDNAIADAVGEFSQKRDETVARENAYGENQRLGFLVHELRNHLQIATIAFSGLEAGKLGIGGSTAGLVRRSLASLSALLSEAISEVRLNALPEKNAHFSVASFIADAEATASIYAGTTGCTLVVAAVDPLLVTAGNRSLLAAALANLLQNAFKFTHPHTEVRLTARGTSDRVIIEVQDCCGGLQAGAAQQLFQPFEQANFDKSGLGLGLSIARQSIQADGGSLTVADLPGKGCIFTMDLPRRATSKSPA